MIISCIQTTTHCAHNQFSIHVKTGKTLHRFIAHGSNDFSLMVTIGLCALTAMKNEIMNAIYAFVKGETLNVKRISK